MQTGTRPMATRRSPRNAGEKTWKRSRRCTQSTTNVGRANGGGKGRGRWGKRRQGAGLRRDPMCSAMSHKPDPQPSQPPAVRAEVARMQAGAAPRPPLPASSATFAHVSSPSSPESRETVRGEGPGATGRRRGEGAVVGKGEGGDKGGQAEAGRGGAEGVAAEAEGQGEGQGQRAAEGPRADPFNVVDVRAGMDMRRREWRSQRESVVADILEVSEDEGEGAGRMAVEGGPGQPSAPNVPAAAMTSILPEVRRQEEGKGGQGQLEAGAAGSGDSSVSAGGRGRTGKGGKGQAGTSGAVHAKGHLAGKGGKGSGRGRQWPQPQRSFRQPQPRSPPRVSAAVRAEEEREVRRQHAARYEALAQVEHQRRRRQPPEQGPDTMYQLEMEPGRTGMRGGRAGQSSAAVQGSGAGHVEAGKGKQRKGARQQGLQGKGQGTAGLHGVGGKGRGAMGRQGKGQGKGSGLGYMGSAVFPGTGWGWWGGVVRPAVRPIIPPFPPPPYPAIGMVYPPLPAYPGMQPQAHMQQHQQAGGTAWGAQEGKGEEHRRAWERLGEAERSLRERDARVKGEVGGAEEGRTEGTDRPQGGEAQAVEELLRAWADLQRRQEGVERAEQEGGRQEEGRGREDTPLVPFRQPAIPPEQEGEMQERAWRLIRGEAARLADRDREVAARERRVREEEEAVARGAHGVLPDPEGDTPSTDVEGRSPSGKRAREEDEEAGQERGKRRRGEERGAGEAEGAPRPASPSPEPTPTDWDSDSPPPRQYAEEATGHWDARRIVGTASSVGQNERQTGSSIGMWYSDGAECKVVTGENGRRRRGAALCPSGAARRQGSDLQERRTGRRIQYSDKLVPGSSLMV